MLECAANLACVGAEPLGVTNCLNFGNPERPARRVAARPLHEGLADACEALGVPVVGGNVSLYNETEAGPIYPTPVIGMVGELPDPATAAGIAFAAGDAVALVGPFAPSLAGSELAKLRGELGPGLPALPSRARPGCDRARSRGSAAGRLAAPTTSPTAASPAPSPSARSRVGSASAPISTRWSSSAAGRARRACSGRGPGGFVVAGERRRSRSWPP